MQQIIIQPWADDVLSALPQRSIIYGVFPVISKITFCVASQYFAVNITCPLIIFIAIIRSVSF